MASNVTSGLSNIAVIGGIILITFGVTAVALASKVSEYTDTAGKINLTVRKQEFPILSYSSGSISKVDVTVGQHVTKGTTLLTIRNDILQHQIDALKQYSGDNVSAQTQLSIFEVEKEKLTTYAPTDGVIAEIASEGEPVSDQETIGTLYASDDVQLLGQLSLSDYQTVQNQQGQLIISDDRLGQKYPVKLSLIKQEASASGNNLNPNLVNAVFSFVNPPDATNLLQNEQVKLTLPTGDISQRPFTRVVNWYRSLFDKQGSN